MTQLEHVEQHAGLADFFAFIVRFIIKTCIVIEIEARKLSHDPSELITRAIQPALWILVFGQVIGRVRAFPTGSLKYIDFMTPGILAQSVLFISIFYGISVLWERDLGITHKLLVSPTPRTALVLGKALSASVRSLSQAIVVYALALITGVKMNWNPSALAGVLVTIIIGSCFFSTFSLIIACIVKTRERFMGIGQVLTMPMFFASNAIYPISIMPTWLQVVSRINPLSYMVDILRSLMIQGGSSVFGVGIDFMILLGWTILFILIGGRLYATIVQ